MNLSGAVVGLGLVTVVYLAVLVWLELTSGLLQLAPGLPRVVTVLVSCAMGSWAVRFCRWNWLMRRAGHSPPVLRAGLAYLAGFAFTATPGKVGELVRIRYFLPLGVPARLVVGLFVYERCLDLLVVLVLAMAGIGQVAELWIAAVFVGLLIGAVLAVAGNPAWLDALARLCEERHLLRPAQAARTLAGGLADARRWINWRDVTASLILGFIAWGLMAISFSWLIGQLQIDLATGTGLAIFPLSMLIGAASILPGGLGSTEASIVALLVINDAPVAVATLAAVAARLSSLWSAVAFGMVALALSEYWKRRRDRP